MCRSSKWEGKDDACKLHFLQPLNYAFPPRVEDDGGLDTLDALD